MSEIELQDAILRHALELQRLSAHEEAEAEAILRQLEAELRALLNSRTLNEATKREIEALANEAQQIIDARYATIAGTLDTHGLVVLVADRTVETIKLIAPTVAKLSVETLASLSKSVLIEGAPTAAWWEKQSEDTAFKFAAAVRQGVVNNSNVIASRSRNENEVAPALT